MQHLLQRTPISDDNDDSNSRFIVVNQSDLATTSHAIVSFDGVGDHPST
jgi:hypothetical protein